MNWEQIKKHPFIVNNVDNFHFIELKKVKDIDSNQFEMNSKNSDNLCWALYNGKNINFNLDKFNINLNENKKKEIEKNINENQVKNEDIQKIKEETKKIIEEEKKD